MNFKKWVKNIQTASYNGGHTVVILVIMRENQVKPFCDKNAMDGAFIQ